LLFIGFIDFFYYFYFLFFNFYSKDILMVHYIRYLLSNECQAIYGASDIYLMKYTSYKIEALIEKDLIITTNNIRILLYNIFKDRVDFEHKANSNYFNSFNNYNINLFGNKTPILFKNSNSQKIKIKETKEILTENMSFMEELLLEIKIEQDKVNKEEKEKEREKEEKKKEESRKNNILTKIISIEEIKNEEIIRETIEKQEMEKKEKIAKIMGKKIENDYIVDNTYNIYGEKINNLKEILKFISEKK